MSSVCTAYVEELLRTNIQKQERVFTSSCIIRCHTVCIISIDNIGRVGAYQSAYIKLRRAGLRHGCAKSGTKEQKNCNNAKRLYPPPCAILRINDSFSLFIVLFLYLFDVCHQKQPVKT